MSSLNNLAITATNSAMTSAMGAMFNTLQSKIANGGRDRNCKFYYNDGAGGSILQVAVKGAVGGAVSALKNEAVNAFNSLLNGKRTKSNIGSAWIESELKKQEEEAKEYGYDSAEALLDEVGKTTYRMYMLQDDVMAKLKTMTNVETVEETEESSTTAQ